jgi:predicted aspartyl protease
MGAIIRSHPASDEAIEAHRRLASLYLTHGKYREALARVDAVLALRTDDSDARDIRPLLATLSESPDQEVVRTTRTTLEIHEDGLQFSIHGLEATYGFDTGANFSILSESEARRFGLRVRDVATKVSVSTGARVGLRIAVADEPSSVRLKNVEFLVFPDDQPPFNQQTPGSRGLIGIPVLCDLRSSHSRVTRPIVYLPKGSMTNETVQSHMSDRPCARYAGNSERSQSQQSFGMLLHSSVMRRAQVWESGEPIPVRPCRKSPPPWQIWLDLSCTSSFCQSPQLTGAL